MNSRQPKRKGLWFGIAAIVAAASVVVTGYIAVEVVRGISAGIFNPIVAEVSNAIVVEASYGDSGIMVPLAILGAGALAVFGVAAYFVQSWWRDEDGLDGDHLS